MVNPARMVIQVLLARMATLVVLAQLDLKESPALLGILVHLAKTDILAALDQ